MFYNEIQKIILMIAGYIILAHHLCAPYLISLLILYIILGAINAFIEDKLQELLTIEEMHRLEFIQKICNVVKYFIKSIGYISFAVFAIYNLYSAFIIATY